MNEDNLQSTIVPSNIQNYYDYYTIQKGDSLYGISSLDMEEYIYPNQQILVPKSGFSYYITKEGDTLDIAANMFKISKDDLIQKNGVVYLSEGQVLVNPR